MSWTVSLLSPYAAPFSPKKPPEPLLDESRYLPADLLVEISRRSPSPLPLSPSRSSDGQPTTPLLNRVTQGVSNDLPSVRIGQSGLSSQSNTPNSKSDSPTLEPSQRRVVPESIRLYPCLSPDKRGFLTQEKWVHNMMVKLQREGVELSSLESIAKYYWQQMCCFSSLNLS